MKARPSIILNVLNAYHHPPPGNQGYLICPLSQYSCWLFLYTASLMSAPYIPDIRLETYGRYCLYEIGFVTVAGGWSMTWFQWKLNLWIWCSGVWPMNCFGRNRCHFGCFTLGWSGSGSEIRDHADHGRSNELMNFCPEWSHQCIWSTIIQVISDHLSWSGTSQRKANIELVNQ